MASAFRSAIIVAISPTGKVSMEEAWPGCYGGYPICIKGFVPGSMDLWPVVVDPYNAWPVKVFIESTKTVTWGSGGKDYVLLGALVLDAETPGVPVDGILLPETG